MQKSLCCCVGSAPGVCPKAQLRACSVLDTKAFTNECASGDSGVTPAAKHGCAWDQLPFWPKGCAGSKCMDTRGKPASVCSQTQTLLSQNLETKCVPLGTASLVAECVLGPP